MNTKCVNQFMRALRQADDASALSLLENGRVIILSVCFATSQGVRISHPIIFPAIQFVRERVARALVRLGGNIDTFRDYGDGDYVTSAGDVIIQSNLPALSICVRLGANLACVYRSADSPPDVCSSVGVTIANAWHVPLRFLLEAVYKARPVCLIESEADALVGLAGRGSSAKVIFELLESRGFKFKNLEEMKCSPSEETLGARSKSDVLLAYAQKSGAPDLMRYLVKDLGMVSTASRLEGLKDGVDNGYRHVHGGDVPRTRTDLTKYSCPSCEFVGATEFCSRCRVPRYCSKECQCRHWITGGHKKEYKAIIQRRILMEEEDMAGPSGSAGSRES